jgi:hypothetical protein
MVFLLAEALAAVHHPDWHHRALAPVTTPSTTFFFQPACPRR